MFKKAMSLILAICMMFFMVSCMITKKVRPATIPVNHIDKIRVMSIQTKSGFYYRFARKDPGRIQNGAVVGFLKNKDGEWKEWSFPLSDLNSIVIIKNNTGHTIMVIGVITVVAAIWFLFKAIISFDIV